MSISQYAKLINLPICKYLDDFHQLKTQSKLDKIQFLSGDPTVYGLQQFRMPEQGYQIIRKNIREQNNHGYTLSNGIVKAREAVLKLYKPTIEVGVNKVFLNHGVNMGLLSVLMSFCNPGDQILVPELGYPFFSDVCPALKIKAIPYRLLKEKNFQIDLCHLSSLITPLTQFLFVINPSNPMGTIFSLEHMQQIINFCDQNQLPIVADQVYLRQNFQKVQYKSFGEVTQHVPVIALCGLEKVFSVPGWCTSWTVVFDKHNYLQNIVRNIGTLCTIFLHTNRFTQQALDQLIQKVGLFTHNKMHLIQKRYNYAYNLSKTIPFVSPIPAQGTIYLSIQIDFSQLNKEVQNDKQLSKLLFQEYNVSALPLSVFGSGIQGLRLITCAGEQVFDDFFNRLKMLIQSKTIKHN